MQALAHAATLARLAAIAAVLALVGLLGIRPSIGDAPSAFGMGPLPACRYDDIQTAPGGYDDWETTLVDTILRLPTTYVPPDLVRVADLGVPGKGKVRGVMAEDLKAMSDAAAAAEVPIGVNSPYRSYAQQVNVYAKWVRVYGEKRARQLSARPGHSEHQLGLAIDFQSEPPVATLATSWGATPAGTWMRKHAWEYGFIMSYPKGRIATVCYDYEPWHFRYVGREVAAAVHDSGLTLRAYLWRHYTTAVVPKVTPKPTTNPTPETTHGAPLTTPEPSGSAPASEPPTTAPVTSPALPSQEPQASATGAPIVTPQGTPTSPGRTPPPIAAEPVSTLAPIVLGGAGLALGTIVLGGALLARRRGRRW